MTKIMEPKFEIHIMKNEYELFKTYKADILPMKRDKIHLDSLRAFLVDHRIIPSTDSNKIIVYGTFVSLDNASIPL